MIMSECLLLRIVTPEKEWVYDECDSVNLCVNDNRKGKGGGSYGIHKGHTDAIFSLSEGKLYALKNGEVVVDASASSGFAKVEKNIVTVVVDDFETV